MIRFPTKAEKSLYEQAANDNPPPCVLVKLYIPGWISGITIGPVIFHETDRPDLIVHEMVHVRQFYRQPFTFWIRYLWQRRKGYRTITYEQEAYALQERAKDIMA